jgi:hypothetical protein
MGVKFMLKQSHINVVRYFWSGNKNKKCSYSGDKSYMFSEIGSNICCSFSGFSDIAWSFSGNRS